MFQVNFYQFIRGLFPWFLRQAKTLALIKALIKPLQDVNDSFVTFRNDIAFLLAFNAQVIYLQQYLNTVFPNSLIYPANIHILDGANIDYFYLYRNIEAQPPVYLYRYSEGAAPRYLYRNSELVAGAFSYIIRVPSSVQAGVDWNGQPYSETLLRSYVDQYNNAGRTYTIQYF